uniref:Uncharacterized protein n=1 Tax=Rhizophora mucronata TaxID=61149 RepID=A0A2P2K8L7_RHIMU
MNGKEDGLWDLVDMLISASIAGIISLPCYNLAFSCVKYQSFFFFNP